MRSLITCALLLGLMSAHGAQSGGSFDITRSSIDNGGRTSSGEALQLFGSIGQADAGSEQTGNGFSLRGGLLIGINSTPQGGDIFQDGFEEG